MKITVEGSVVQVQQFVASLKQSGSMQAELYGENLMMAPANVAVNIFHEKKTTKKRKYMTKNHRFLSAEARKAISDAQKKRWAKAKRLAK